MGPMEQQVRDRLEERGLHVTDDVCAMIAAAVKPAARLRVRAAVFELWDGVSVSVHADEYGEASLRVDGAQEKGAPA